MHVCLKVVGIKVTLGTVFLGAELLGANVGQTTLQIMIDEPVLPLYTINTS